MVKPIRAPKAGFSRSFVAFLKKYEASGKPERAPERRAEIHVTLRAYLGILEDGNDPAFLNGIKQAASDMMNPEGGRRGPSD